MKRKSIASVVMEFFESGQAPDATINDILKFYVDKHGEGNPVDLKKAQHAIYLKLNRLVKAGELIVLGKKKNAAIFGLANSKSVKSKPQLTKDTLEPDSNERDILLKRKAELEYELETCIAEAQDYEDMKSILPERIDLLTKQKQEAKKRAIQLHGRLTSTKTILHAVSP